MNSVKAKKIKRGLILKRQRKGITLDLKVNIISKVENGERPSDIARIYSLPASTVHTIIKNKNKIQDCAKNATQISKTKIIKQSDSFIIKMESLLATWIKQFADNNCPIKFGQIQDKAKNLYEELRRSDDGKAPTTQGATFAASRGWFHRFRHRYSLQNVKITCENIEVPQNHHENFRKQLESIIKDGKYSYKQVFNIDETGLYWKKLPASTFISRDEQNSSGYKPAKDRLSVLLGSNAYGDKKLKPLVVYHTEDPEAFKHVVKSKLPTNWMSQRKAWITKQIFREWLVTYGVNELKEYCEMENLAFDILLVLDNSTSHSLDYELLFPNIKVVFLPAKLTSILQPMSQGIVAMFKACYLQRTLDVLLDEVRNKGHADLKKFWKNFNILQGVQNIGLAWDDVSCGCLNVSWTTTLLKAVRSFDRLDHTNSINKNIVRLANQVGFDEVTVEDVAELLQSHSVALTTDELLKLEQERLYEETEDDTAEVEHPTAQKMKRLFELSDEMIKIVRECDPLWDRSTKVVQGIQSALACYREIYGEKMDRSVEPGITVKLEQDEEERTAVWLMNYVDTESVDLSEIKVEMN